MVHPTDQGAFPRRGDQPLAAERALRGTENAPAESGTRRPARKGENRTWLRVENINFFGAIEVGIDAELAQLGPTGYRPLRVRDTIF